MGILLFSFLIVLTKTRNGGNAYFALPQGKYCLEIEGLCFVAETKIRLRIGILQTIGGMYLAREEKSIRG